MAMMIMIEKTVEVNVMFRNDGCFKIYNAEKEQKEKKEYKKLLAQLVVFRKLKDDDKHQYSKLTYQE